jgi:hypothetical protein
VAGRVTPGALVVLAPHTCVVAVVGRYEVARREPQKECGPQPVTRGMRLRCTAPTCINSTEDSAESTDSTGNS